MDTTDPTPGDRTQGLLPDALATDLVLLRELQGRYGDVVTRQAWHELDDIFEPDCPVSLDLRNGTQLSMTGPRELGSFIGSSVAQFELFVFTIVNSAISVAPDGVTATARLYICELRQGRADGRWTQAYGLYEDTYRRGDPGAGVGGWRFAGRRYSSLARHRAGGEGMEVFSVPGLE